MKYLKKFLNHQDYESYITGDTAILPNVSLCETENEIHYNPATSPSETRLIVTYSGNEEDMTQLYVYAEGMVTGEMVFDNIEIDGVDVSIADIDSDGGAYQLSPDIHTVRYTLKDPTFIGVELDPETHMPTKVGAALMGCANIVSVEIPNTVTTIGDVAFSACNGLSSITIPDSVTSIGDGVFQNCSGLTSITIPDSVTSIGDGVFQNCSGLTSITIPDSVTSIGVQAFSNCYSLQSITIPDSITSIVEGTFVSCSSLTSITIPDSVTSIGDGAFNYCGSLTSVTIGSGVTSIGDEAFGNCGSLIHITSYATTAPTINNETFKHIATGGTLYYPDGSDYSQWLSNNYYYLGYYGWNNKVEAKLYLSNGTTVDITGEGVLTRNDIEQYSATTRNAQVYTDIAQNAFSGFTNLTGCSINSVASIGDSAFRDCSSLADVYLEPLTPPTLGVNVFDGNAQGRIIYVPEGTINTYISAQNWSTYASDIIEDGK